MNTRIKKLRKTLDLTQQAFADRLGIRQNTVAKYETNRGIPTRAVISLICREFNVNENWLRTGEGEMFQPKATDELDEILARHGIPPEFRALAESFIDMKPEEQKAVTDYMQKVAAAISSGSLFSSTAESYTADQTAPHVPPGYSSRAELEAEADEFAAMAREQFLSEKIPGYQAFSANNSDEPDDLLA